MRTASLSFVLAFVVLVGFTVAQQGPERGQIKNVDLDKGVVTITSGGKDFECALTPQTMLRTADNQELPNFRKKGLPAVMEPTVPPLLKPASND